MKPLLPATLLGLATVGFIGGALSDSSRRESPVAAPVPPPCNPSASVSATSAARDTGIPACAPIPSNELLFWAQRDPAAAGHFLRAQPDSDERQQALAAVLRHWMRLDLAAAADFALSLPDSAARARALEQVAITWTAHDPVAASAWAEALPLSPELDTFAAAIATVPGLASLQPDTALSWAGSITGDELRTQTLGLILDACVAHDPAAYTYLVTTPEAAPARKTLFASTVTTR